MSDSRIDAAERKLADRFQRRHCVLVGSGTTALYACFRAIQPRGTTQSRRETVLFPDITCETAVNAAIFAGLKPSFCDVSLSNYNMVAAQATVEDCLAVVPTHIFGHLMNVDELQAFVPARTWVIEDAAQAYGGELFGHPAGSFGHASVVSFGPGKTLDCGDGGAIFSDDPAFVEECRREVARLSEFDGTAEEHRTALMHEMLEARRSWRGEAAREQLISGRCEILRAHRKGYLSVCAPTVAERVDSNLSTLDEISRQRVNFAQIIDRALGKVDLAVTPQRSGDEVLWRYSFLVEEGCRDESVTALKRNRIDASKLFPTCQAKFRAKPCEHPGADEVSRRIINVRMPASRPELDHLVGALTQVFQ